MPSEDLSAWRDRLGSLIAGVGPRIADRVAVVAETASTQDAARSMAGGRPGLIVLAGRQTAGRGRLGRDWVQRADLGVAMTIALDAARFQPEFVSLAAGVAAAEAVAAAVPDARIGLRWPNDVIECSRARKVAGVLIEREPPLLLLGIGVNVLEHADDWPEPLRGRAASIHELGGAISRIDLAAALLGSLDRALAEDPARLVARWGARDVLTGHAASFMSAGRRFDGTVLGIDPATAIRLRLSDGVEVRLPALTTSLVHG